MAGRRREPRPLPRAKTHEFADSGVLDYADRPICSCGQISGSRVHHVERREQSEDARQVGARIVGEAEHG